MLKKSVSHFVCVLLEDYGNLNPVDFFSQREFVQGPCFLSEGRICTTFAILYFPFTPHTT